MCTQGFCRRKGSGRGGGKLASDDEAKNRGVCVQTAAERTAQKALACMPVASQHGSGA